LSTAAFAKVLFELGPIGPPGSTWTSSSSGDTFMSAQTGSYEIKYKVDVYSGSGGGDQLDAATVLTLDGNPVSGSCTVVQAPHNNHVYTISNTVLVNYIANQSLSLFLWTSDTKNGVSIGSPDYSFPKLPGNISVKEATSSLVITRIQ
jgi:hypothetical protein